MAVITTQFLMNPFLVFGGPPPAATFILRSGGADAYLLESTGRYLLDDVSGIYELESSTGAVNILRSPDDGSKIERSD